MQFSFLRKSRLCSIEWKFRTVVLDLRVEISFNIYYLKKYLKVDDNRKHYKRKHSLPKLFGFFPQTLQEKKKREEENFRWKLWQRRSKWRNYQMIRSHCAKLMTNNVPLKEIRKVHCKDPLRDELINREPHRINTICFVPLLILLSHIVGKFSGPLIYG